MELKDWQKKNTTLITMRLTNSTDADILKFLNTVDSKQGLIKRLLREEMKRQGFEHPHQSIYEKRRYEKYLEELEQGKDVGDYKV